MLEYGVQRSLCLCNPVLVCRSESGKYVSVLLPSSVLLTPLLLHRLLCRLLRITHRLGKPLPASYVRAVVGRCSIYPSHKRLWHAVAALDCIIAAVLKLQQNAALDYQRMAGETIRLIAYIDYGKFSSSYGCIFDSRGILGHDVMRVVFRSGGYNDEQIF